MPQISFKHLVGPQGTPWVLARRLATFGAAAAPGGAVTELMGAVLSARGISFYSSEFLLAYPLGLLHQHLKKNLGQMDTEVVVHILNGILVSYKKECI